MNAIFFRSHLIVIILIALTTVSCTDVPQQVLDATGLPQTPIHSVTPQHGQNAFTYESKGGRLNYLLFLPQEYSKDPQQEWPLIVFLHGIAKRGDSIEELETLKIDGIPLVVENQPDFPFIALSPQCPSGSFWETQLNLVDQLLDETMLTYAVDVDRIYLTGLSMGGYGAWHYALSQPEQFSAIVPIAGGHVPESDEIPDNICDLKNTSIWVFHGDQDDVVLPRQSEVLVDALESCGADVRFTLYPGADHDDSWKQAYADPELYDWLLDQTRE